MLLRPPDKKHFPSHWDLPGGKLEEGEGEIEGLKREILEETKLVVKDQPLFMGEFESEAHGKIWMVKVFIIEQATGECTINEEHIDYKWVSKGEMKVMKKPPYVQKVLARLYTGGD